MLPSQPDYKNIARYKFKYVVYEKVSIVHRYVLVQKKDSDLPFLTIELTTVNGLNSDLAQGMRIFSPPEVKSQSPHEIGVYEGSLMDICKVADSVFEEMKSNGPYGLFDNNCQHFCNNLIQRLCLNRTFPTTLPGPNTTLIDNGEKKCDSIKKGLGEDFGGKVCLIPGNIKKNHEPMYC